MTESTQAAAAVRESAESAARAADAALSTAQSDAGFGADDVESAADAVVATTHWFERFFGQLFANLSWENVLLQIAAVAVAIGLGVMLSRMLRGRIHAITSEGGVSGVRGVIANLKHLALGILENISFGLIAGSILALESYALVVIGGYPSRSFVLCRIFYSFFYAYSLLSIVLGFLQAAVGRNVITPSLRKSVTIIFWCLAVLQFFGVLGALVDLLDETRIPIGSGDMTLWKLVMAVFSVLLTLAVANWISSLLSQVIEAAPNLSGNQKVVLSRILTVGLVVLAVIIGLGTVGIDLTILSVFGGALGVGLGFGLQKIASNYISGFIILLDKSIKIGDLVSVGGFRGKVTEINTRFTVVRSADGIENIVPNETFVTTAVQNFSYTDTAAIQYVGISIAYGADVDRALAIMLEEASRERPRITKDRKGWAYIKGWGDSGIDLELGFWLDDPVNGSAGMKTQVALAVYKRFLEEGIEIPYNRLEVTLRDQLVPLRVEQAKA